MGGSSRVVRLWGPPRGGEGAGDEARRVVRLGAAVSGEIAGASRVVRLGAAVSGERAEASRVVRLGAAPLGERAEASRVDRLGAASSEERAEVSRVVRLEAATPRGEAEGGRVITFRSTLVPWGPGDRASVVPASALSEREALGGLVLLPDATTRVRGGRSGGGPTMLRARLLRLAPSILDHHFEEMMESVARIGERFFSVTQSNAWGLRTMAALKGPGRGSSMPRAIVRAHSEELRVAGSLEVLARNRMLARADRRVSRARVMAVTEYARAVYAAGGIPGGDRALAPVSERRFLKDIELLSEVAENGVPIMVDLTFQPIRKRGRQPQQYVMYEDAINAHNWSNAVADHILVLSAEAYATVKNPHLMGLGFAPMYGKEKGRITANCSGVAGGRAQRGDKPGLVPLNTPNVAMKGAIKYGAIRHPTIEDVAVMVDTAIKEYGIDSVVIFKENLRGFFQLVNFDPRFVHLMTFAYYSDDKELVDAVLVCLAGNFGWTVMPFIMEVATRILRVTVQGSISGYSLQYCDDIMAAAHRGAWKEDQATIKRIVEDLFGPGAYAADKSESSEDNPERRLDILGWAFILSTRRVDLAPKNRDKLFYTFMTADPSKGLSLRKRQQLCAYADRTALVFVELGALNKMLFTMLGGQDTITNPEAPYAVTNEKALVAIDVWKTYLMMSEHQHRIGAVVGRPLSVFLPGPPRGVIEFDGSLDGVGWRIFDGNNVCVLSGYRVVTESFYPSDYTRCEGSQWQNSMELVAPAVAMVHMATSGWRDCQLQLRGDSMTVLHWLTDWRFNSTRAVFPTILIIVLCERLNIRFVKEFEHIDSKANIVCDCLSRGKVAEAQRLGFCGSEGPEPGIKGGLLEKAMGLISLNAELTLDIFFERWALCEALVDQAVRTRPGRGNV